MSHIKKCIEKILTIIFSKWIQRKTTLTKIQCQELANCLVPLLYHINGLHLRRNRILLRALFNGMNWHDFSFTQEQFIKQMTSQTYRQDYREPIGVWFTIDSEDNYANAPKIQNTDRVTYYASGREPFLAVINHIKTENKTVLVPYFTCRTVYQPFEENGWKKIYYRTDKDLRFNRQEVEELYEKHKPAIAVFMEYSGMDLTDEELQTIGKLKRAGCVTIVDRTQNIYSETRNEEIDYYCGSLRKWFCIPDGAYLERNGDASMPPAPHPEEYNDVYATICGAKMYTNGLLRRLKIAESWGIGEFFHRLSAQYVCTQPVRTRNMSEYAKAVYLQERGKDAEYTSRRKSNFEYIFRRIAALSTVKPVCSDLSRFNSVPFYFHVYADDRTRLAAYLQKKGVVTWVHVPRPPFPNALDDQTEYMFAHILSIPCDQRYTEADMKILCDALEEYEKEYGKTACMAEG